MIVDDEPAGREAVRISRVEVLHRDRDGGGAVVLRGGMRLRVARARWEALEEALGL